MNLLDPAKITILGLLLVTVLALRDISVYLVKKFVGKNGNGLTPKVCPVHETLEKSVNGLAKLIHDPNTGLVVSVRLLQQSIETLTKQVESLNLGQKA